MIQFNDIASQWKEIEPTTLPILTEFLRTGPYILGAQGEAFEKEFAAYCGTKFAVGISNGTDGLKLALQYVKDQNHYKCVLLPANGYIADALAPLYNRLAMRLIDCDEYYNIDPDCIEKNIGDPEGHYIVLAVHLYGQAANIPAIKEILPNSIIIEDCSQAHGASIKNRKVGSLGDIGVFSLYPTKNLGAMGDAGIITTNDEVCYNRLKALRNYGSMDKNDYYYFGHNNRLDEMQALILREKLKHMDKWISIKKSLANLYIEQLKDLDDIILPENAPYNDGSTYHIFPIRTSRRDQLKFFLESKNIPTLIHYPTLIQKTKIFHELCWTSISTNALQYSKEILSLPMHPYLTEDDIKYISETIKTFFK